MKWIIYLLLLANISFFAWHYQAVDRDEQRAQTEQQNSSDGAVSLVMLKEAKIKPELQVEVKSDGPQCHSLGPFKKRKQAEQVKNRLQEDGVLLSFRMSNESKRKGYWVYLSPLADHEAARKKARTLKKKHGIKDIFIVGTGEKKNGISLGVFSKFELAYRRQSEIRNLGYDAQLTDVKLPTKEFWLDWPESSNIDLSSEQLEGAREINDVVAIIEVDCPS